MTQPVKFTCCDCGAVRFYRLSSYKNAPDPWRCGKCSRKFEALKRRENKSNDLQP